MILRIYLRRENSHNESKMKHLFIIHSHTPFLTAIGTIDLLKIESKDVVFFYSRGYKNDVIKHDFKVVETTELTELCRTTMFTSRKNTKNALQMVDELVEREVGEDYILYAPHYIMPICQALYTNKRCIKGAYIQEGGIPMRNLSITNLPKMKKLYYFLLNRVYRGTGRIWRPSAWYVEGSLKKQSVIESYAISSSFFKSIPTHNNIVKWPQMPHGFKFNIKFPSTIFVLDGFITNGQVEPDYYMQKCNDLIGLCGNKNQNYIKFHPAQPLQERNAIIDMFKSKSLPIEEFSDSVPFELVLTSTENLNIAGFGSSLLYFARDLGHQVTCKDEWLFNSPTYMEYKKRFNFDSFSESE